MIITLVLTSNYTPHLSFVRTPLSFAIFSILSTSIFAESTIESLDKIEKTAITLNTISLEAKKEEKNEVGKTVYTKEDIQRTPNSSKNITNFLKVNPNVQFNNKFRNGLQQGELNPADISINGGLPYDNKFLINGISINNNINPASTANGHNVQELMGNSQTVAVNTDLLCNITVLDSNVSAEYGEFTGGVVSAETCAPNTEIGKIHGSITYDYTSDAWSKINFTDAQDKEDFENSASESNQPFFTKQGVSATAYAKVTDKFAFNSYASYRDSQIPLKTKLKEPTHFDQSRSSSNIGFEAFYTPSETTSLKTGVQFMESYGQYFQSDMANSESEHTSNSANISFNLKNKFTNFDLEQQLNLQSQIANRQGASGTYTWQQSSTKNWKLDGSQKEGSFGVMEQQEKKLEYSIKALINPFKFKNTTHNIKLGAGYGHYSAYWERPNTVNIYSGAQIQATSCIDSVNGEIIEACDIGDGTETDSQFMKSRVSYLAGKINVQQDRTNIYLEDKIQWDKYLTANIGLRADYDSLTKNYNIAPRSSITFKPFDSSHVYFTGGWNRYYGLNAFYNELQDRKNSLVISNSRTSPTNNWNTATFNPQYSYRSQLDTPYSDEILFAINGEFANLKMGLKWINRKNEDQLNRTAAVKDPNIDSKASTYTYDNSGKSKSDIYSFTLQNITPLTFNNSQHSFNLTADYTKTKRNFNTYSDTIRDLNETVYYINEYIKESDVPANDYNIPWTIRLGWNISFDNMPININNFFSYKSNFNSVKRYNKSTSIAHKDASGIAYDTYIPYENKRNLTWDMRATYEIPLSRDFKSIFGLTINNVTNKNYEITDNEGVSSPQIGRQFIADITFKF